MLFPTVTFAVFFTVVLASAWALRPYPRVWRMFLVAAGWVFYAWWDSRFVALLAAAIAANHLFSAGIVAGGRRAKAWLAAGLAANLARRPAAVPAPHRWRALLRPSR